MLFVVEVENVETAGIEQTEFMWGDLNAVVVVNLNKGSSNRDLNSFKTVYLTQKYRDRIWFRPRVLDFESFKYASFTLLLYLTLLITINFK